MRVLGVRLENVGAVSHLSVLTSPVHQQAQAEALPPARMLCVGGEAGSGKSLLLKSMAHALSWITSRLKNENQNGNVLPEGDMRMGSTHCEVELLLKLDLRDTVLSINLIKQRNNTGLSDRVELGEIHNVMTDYRKTLQQNPKIGLPIVAYMGTQRFLQDYSLQPKPAQATEQFDAIDNGVPLNPDIRRFFEWFREQEDQEKERQLNVLQQQLPDSNAIANYPELQKIYQTLAQNVLLHASQNLKATRLALARVLPHLSSWRIERRPKLRFMVTKQGVELEVAQLSTFEKQTLGLVGDLCRRMCASNPDSFEPLSGQGVILIDDADMYASIHQFKNLMLALLELFPHCQFVVTHHHNMDWATGNSAIYALTIAQQVEQNVQLNQLYPRQYAVSHSVIFNPNGTTMTVSTSRPTNNQ